MPNPLANATDDEVMLELRQAELDNQKPEQPQDVMAKAMNGQASDSEIVKAIQTPDKMEGSVERNVDWQKQTVYALSHAIDYVGAKSEMGRIQTTQAVKGAMAFDGLISVEDMLKESDDATLEDLQKNRIDPIESTIPGNVLLRVFGEVGQALPFMSKVMAGGTATAAAGAGVGAGLGLAGGPFAEVTIPGGAAAGAAIGEGAGVFSTASQLGAGSMFRELAKSGLDPGEARKVAAGFGIFSGALNMFRLNKLAASAQKNTAAWLATDAGQKYMTRAVQAAVARIPHVTVEVGGQTLIGTTQAITDMLTKHIIGKIHSIEGLQLTPSQAKERILQATISNFAGAIGLVGGARVLAGRSKPKPITQTELVESVQRAIDASEKLTAKELSENPDPKLVAEEAELQYAQAEASHLTLRASVSKINKRIREAQTEGKPTDALEAQLKVAKIKSRRATREFKALQAEREAEVNVSPLGSQKAATTNVKAKAKVARKLYSKIQKELRTAKRNGEGVTELRAKLRQAEQDLYTLEEKERMTSIQEKVAALQARIEKTGSSDKLETELRSQLVALNLEALAGRGIKLQHDIEKQNQVIRQSSKPKEVEAAKAELVQLRNDRDALVNIRKMIESNPLSPDALQKFAHGAQEAKISVLFLKASKMVISAGIKGRAGGVFDIKANRIALENLVGSAHLDKAIRDKLPKITEIHTPEDLKAFTDKMEALVTEAVKTDTLNKALTRLQGQINRSTTESAGPRKKGTLELDVQKHFLNYKTLIEDKLAGGQAAEKMYDGAMDKLGELLALKEDPKATFGEAQADLELDLRQQLAIAADVIDAFQLKDRSTDPVKLLDLAGRIEEMLDNGKHDVLLKEEQRKAELRSARIQAIALAEGNRPVYTEKVVNGITKIVKHEPSAVSKQLLTHGEHFVGIDGLWEMIAFDSKRPEDLSDLMSVHDQVQQELRDIADAKKDAETVITGGDKRLKGLLEKITDDDSRGVKDKKFEAINQDGKLETYEFTTDQALKVANLMRNPNRKQGLQGRVVVKKDGSPVIVDGQPKLEGNRFTFKDDVPYGFPSFEDQLFKSLSKDELKIADGYLAFFSSKKNADYVQKAYVEEYMLPMSMQEIYDGPGYRVGTEDSMGSQLDVFKQLQTGRRSVTPGSTIALQESFKAYKIEGASKNLRDYITSTRSWANMKDVNRKYNYVLASERLKATVETKLKPTTWQVLKQAHGNVVGTRGIQYVQQNEAFAKLRGNAGAAMTGGKALSAVAQLSGIVSVFQKVTPLQFADGFMRMLSHPKEGWNEIVKGSKYLKNRSEYGDTAVTPESYRGVTKLTIKVAGSFIRGADSLVHILGIPAYHAGYLEAKKAGKTDAEARKAGVYFYETAMNRTQGSTTPDQQSFFAQGGELNKTVLQFYSQPVQGYVQQVAALRRALYHPSVDTVGKAAQVVIAAHLAQGLFATIKNLPAILSDDPKESDDAIVATLSEYIVGPVLPLVGDVLKYSVITDLNAALGTEARVFEPRFLPYQVATSAIKLNADVVEIIKQDGDISPELLFKTLNDYLDSFGLLSRNVWTGGGGLPVKSVIKQGKEVYKRTGEKPIFEYNSNAKEVTTDDSNDSEQ